MKGIHINGLINQYVADSMVFVIKLHNLHWNTVGLDFLHIHNYTEQLYTRFFKTFDDFAEVLKIKGEQPYGSMRDYLQVSTLQEINNQKYTIPQTINIIIEDLSMLLMTAKKLKELSNQENNLSALLLSEQEIQFLEKEIWLLNSTKD
jgi:starvation-inducible DNA-binding protein